MREIIKNNNVVYDYDVHKLSDGVILSIILFLIAILLLILSIVISYMFLGDAPSFVAGIGMSSLIFNAGSMYKIISEIYLHDNFNREVKVMLILQLILFTIWIFIIG